MKKTLGVIVVALLLVGCSRQGWHTKSIAGLMPPLRFTLTEDTGTTVHASDFRGHLTLLYFGYTSCPDVCPATLAKLHAALGRLPNDEGANAQVLFVTVDPKRDTPAHLRKYTAHFGPQFIGLRASPEELTALTKRYRVTYGYGKPDADGDYEVSHSSAVFVFDPRGKARLIIRSGDGVDAVAADLKRLMKDSGGEGA